MIKIYRLVISVTLYVIRILPSIIAAPLPLNESAYGTFLTFLSTNNCKMPNYIELPFPCTTDEPFDCLSTPLLECPTAEAQNDVEVYLLCKEIFEALQNITCLENMPPMKIPAYHFSDDICSDIEHMQGILPKESEYVAGRLVDHLICKVFCSVRRESLCKVLLWSYDVQAKIKSNLKTAQLKLEDTENMENNEIEENEDKTDIDSVNSHMPEEQNILPENKNIKNGKQTKLGTTVHDDPSLNKESLSSKNNFKSLSNTILTSTSVNVSSYENVTPVNISQSRLLNNSQVTVTAALPGNSNIPSETNEPNSDVAYKHKTDISDSLNKQNENVKESVSDAPQHKTTDIDKPSSKLNLSLDIVASTNKIKDGMKVVTVAHGVSENKVTKLQNNKNISDIKNDLEKPVSPSTELNVNNYEEKGESKTKEPTNSDSINVANKDKLNEGISEKDSNNLTSDSSKLFQEITTLQNSNKNEGTDIQDDKEQELYNDSENDADYPKPDFDNSFNQPSKSKDSDFKNPVNVANDINGNEIPSNYDGFLISRNNIGRVADDSIQVIPSFPEQEDSHFFFYFLSIVLILMAGYLIFHNKQKIIALIVEGRHERRRRSHGVGYKKLETK